MLAFSIRRGNCLSGRILQKAAAVSVRIQPGSLQHFCSSPMPRVVSHRSQARSLQPIMILRRSQSTGGKAARDAEWADRNKRFAIYAFSFAIGIVGVSYASVPLYKIFCQATGYGGTTQRVESLSQKVTDVGAVENERPIKVIFNADVSDMMPWRFRPTQPDILVVPGETALAFFTVKNKTDKGVIGVATYNVHPPKAGLYFNKIQCFCFDEQRLKPKEEVDMPVFFFIDPEFLTDPAMDNVHEITLSYTFFKTGEDDGYTQAVPPPQFVPPPNVHKPVRQKGAAQA